MVVSFCFRRGRGKDDLLSLWSDCVDVIECKEIIFSRCFNRWCVLFFISECSVGFNNFVMFFIG